MAYTKELREKILNDIKYGVPIGKISRTYQVSVPTIYNWKKKYLIDHDSFLENDKEKEDKIGESVPRLIDEEVDCSQTKTQLDIKTTLDLEKLEIMPIAEICKELKRLMNTGNLEEVVETIDGLSSRNNPMITSLKVKSLYLLGKRNQDIESIKKAYRTCLRFQDNSLFQQYMEKIKDKFKEIDWSHFEIKEEKETPKPLATPQAIGIIKKDPQNTIIGELITKIYCDFITAAEIENAKIDAWYKDLLMLTLSHKRSRENAISLGKKLKIKYKEDEKKLKVINRLLERIKIKKGINFDMKEYTAHLPVGVDFSLVDKILKKKALAEKQAIKTSASTGAVQNLQIATPVSDSTKLHKKTEKRMIVIEGKPVTARYQQISQSTQETVSKSGKKLKIKDIFESEILQIGKQLYIQMRNPRNVKSGCEAWDRLENLKEKSADDLNALRSMISLIERINCQEEDFIKTNNQRNDQLIAKVEAKQKLKK